MSKKINQNEIYNSILINKFINSIQREGKKSFVEKIFYVILKGLKKNHLNFLLMIFFALEVIKPTVNVISAVKHGKTYFVGTVVSFQNQYFLSIRWITKAIFESKGETIALRILNEILNISFSFKSAALKRKKQAYFLLYKNRSLSHYR